jgi:hypothetical protein
MIFKTHDGNEIDITISQIRELTMRYIFGVSIGELLAIGISEGDIREAFETSLNQAKQATKKSDPS